MNIVDAYIKNNRGLAILVIGYPTEVSNHHMLAEKLSTDLNNTKNMMTFSYQKITDTGARTPINYSEILEAKRRGIVVSSDIIPFHRDVFDFVIFIDTPVRILVSRGLKKIIDLQAWENMKKTYRINRFINDSNASQIFSLATIMNNKTYNNLWDSTMEFIKKQLEGPKN
jgi:hypothetical protein